jgi:hypothetical protein
LCDDAPPDCLIIVSPPSRGSIRCLPGVVTRRNWL